MARRRRGDPPSQPETPQDPLPAGSEPQIEVKMRGSADDVKRQLGVATEARPEPEEGNGQGEEKQEFIEALRNSRYVIRVKRMTPRTFHDIKTNVEVWQAELPLSYQEIREEVAKEHKGGKYRVAVIDPNSNDTVAADVFEVEGDPAVSEEELSPEDRARIFMEPTPKTLSEISEESLDRRAKLSAKMLEVEHVEAQLQDARERRAKPVEKVAQQSDTRVEELERRLTEVKHQAELEARDRMHAEEMRELKALIAQNARPAQSQGPSELAVILNQMSKAQEANAVQFRDLLKTMQDDKMNTMLREIQAIKNKPAQEGGTMIEMVKTFRTMAELMGVDLPGKEDDDDDPDKPWYERLADRYIPKILEKFEAGEASGKSMTREDLMREIDAAAKQAEDEAVKNAQQRLQGSGGRPALPPPPIPPPPAAGASAPVTQLPPPPPKAPSAQPPPAVAAAPIAPPITIEQEMVVRAGATLEMLDREMTFRTNEYHWNYEGAWCSLPADMLEKACAAPDPVSMVESLFMPELSREKVDQMKAKISANPATLAWVKRGHDELKAWWTAKQGDPEFDPFDELDGEVEEGA